MAISPCNNLQSQRMLGRLRCSSETLNLHDFKLGRHYSSSEQVGERKTTLNTTHTTGQYGKNNVQNHQIIWPLLTLARRWNQALNRPDYLVVRTLLKLILSALTSVDLQILVWGEVPLTGTSISVAGKLNDNQMIVKIISDREKCI